MKVSEKYRQIIIVIAILFAISFWLREFMVKDEEMQIIPSPENMRMLDSLEEVNNALLQMMEQQAEESRLREERFKNDVMQLEKEYEKKVAAFDTLSIDEHIRVLADELSKED